MDGPGTLAVLTPLDAGEVLTLQRAAFVTGAQAHRGLIPPLTQTPADLQAELGDRSRDGCGVREAGRLVACVRSHVSSDAAELVRVVVAPYRPGQGIGTWLLARAAFDVAVGPPRPASLARGPAKTPRRNRVMPMPASTGLRFRAACLNDAHAITGLHADSWQRHYRGAYSGAFLDNGTTGYLLPLWTARLAIPDPQARTILAEHDGEVVGVAHTILGEDATWGAFLDNLHVAHGLKRQGIGTRLLALTAQAVLGASPSSGLYLWVLEQNSDARAFYAARGGACAERDAVPPPGGNTARLNGKPMGLRYVWRHPSRLLAGRP